jgi:hypothetical protein
MFILFTIQEQGMEKKEIGEQENHCNDAFTVVSSLTGYSIRYCRMVVAGQRKNKKILELYYRYCTEKSALIRHLENVVIV